MSRLKLKVNNCLLNNKEFFKLFNSIFNKIGYNCFIIFQDYLNIKILKYDENFEILYIFFNFQIFKFFKTFEPPTDGISTPLPMVYWPPYPWYIEPLTYDISTPISMVFWPPLPIEYWPPTHDILTSLQNLLIRNGGVQNTMGVQFTIKEGFSFQ
jgi:hypothetical protein